MGLMEDVSSGPPPDLRFVGPSVKVRGRRATKIFFEREKGGEEREEAGWGGWWFLMNEVTLFVAGVPRP